MLDLPFPEHGSPQMGGTLQCRQCGKAPLPKADWCLGAGPPCLMKGQGIGALGSLPSSRYSLFH